MVSEHASPLALLGGVDAGGQNVHVADLATAMARLGIEVVVHTRRDDPSLPIQVPYAEGVVVSHINAGPPEPIAKDDLPPHMPAFAQRLAEAWIDDPPAAVHSHFWMSGQAALTAARPLDIPVVHTFHALGTVKRRHQGLADSSPRQRIPVETAVAREVDRVIATTNDEARELVVMGVDPDRISVVPCGVDLARFTPCGAVERRHSSRRRIVVVSRLVERKGIGNVIEAVACLPDVELVIAGGPPAGLLYEDAAAQRFLTLAAELGIADRVELRGSVSRACIPGLLRSADVVACCPWYEPFGLVAIEAMACGIPVVASRVGGLAESVVDGRTGIHVPPRSPSAMASAFTWMFRHDEKRRAMGVNAARWARRFGWDRIAAETLDVIQRVNARSATRMS
jgi:glycosyltransferase involved in cell wall biosynthesis